MTSQQARRAAWEREYQTARVAVLERCCGVCERCGEARAEHVHHKLRRLHSRANELGFLAALCEPCHTTVHANPADSYADGWLIHYDSVPEVQAFGPTLDADDPFVQWCDQRGIDPVAKAAEFGMALDEVTP